MLLSVKRYGIIRETLPGLGVLKSLFPLKILPDLLVFSKVRIKTDQLAQLSDCEIRPGTAQIVSY